MIELHPAALDAALAEASPRSALVLPTTATVIAWLQRAAEASARPWIVAPRLACGLAPEVPLAQLAEGLPPRTVILLSDQLLAPQEAPLAVQSARGLHFLSAFEALLALRHEYTLRLWPEAVIPPGQPELTVDTVLRALHQHLVACERLGPEWLMAAAQNERGLERRLSLARRELRFLEAVLFRAYRQREADSQLSRLLDRIAEHERALTHSAKGLA